MEPPEFEIIDRKRFSALDVFAVEHGITDEVDAVNAYMHAHQDEPRYLSLAYTLAVQAVIIARYWYYSDRIKDYDAGCQCVNCAMARIVDKLGLLK